MPKTQRFNKEIMVKNLEIKLLQCYMSIISQFKKLAKKELRDQSSFNDRHDNSIKESRHMRPSNINFMGSPVGGEQRRKRVWWRGQNGNAQSKWL